MESRTEKDNFVLKSWLKDIDFFIKYPDIIMDRVCEKLKPIEYPKSKIIIDIGEEVIL